LNEARSSQTATLLVVDDEARNRKLLEGYLRAEGYEVLMAVDGPSALLLVKERQPDVILLDVMMPGMTGHEVCRKVKADSRSRLSQVMMVTALADIADKVEGLDTGADDYLAKPVRREELLAKVRALLRARQLLGELEQARDALAARNEELQLKKTLAQTLVHDMKSPLTAVIGNLDLLQLRSQDELQYLITRSKRGADRMLQMILNLLDVEKLEEGALTPNRGRVDAISIARASIEEADTAAERARVELVLEAPEPAFIAGDADLLRRVLDNLVANGIAHSPADSQVIVGVAVRPEGVELSVSDGGPGIPEELRESIFEKYAQVGRSDGAGGSNRGLGLTLCRLAIEAHGGAIWVERAPGGGSRFTAVLPDAEVAAPREAQAAGAKF
jgi:signal transduction histidine kinase